MAALRSAMTKLSLAAVVDPDRLRPIDAQSVASLTLDIAARGLMAPLVVWRAGGVYRLIAGGCRLEALRCLSRAFLEKGVEVDVRAEDDPDLRIREIDDGLGRRLLSACDRALYLAERLRIDQERRWEKRARRARRATDLRATRFDATQFLQEAQESSGVPAADIEAAYRLATALEPSVLVDLRGSIVDQDPAEASALCAMGAIRRHEIARAIANGRRASVTGWRS